MIADSRQDQFGFYQADAYRSYSKFEAIEYGQRHNCQVQWIFNDLVFSAYDWSVEPAESLNELYRARAQQLREKYDYLVLFYSGGADSNNILDTFIDNHIPLDEVVSYMGYDATGDKYDHYNGEVFNVAIPKVESIRLVQPSLRHTIIDTSQMTVNFFNKQQSKFDWIYFVNHYANPNNVSRRDIRLSQPHWLKMYADGRRVGFVFGAEKPRVKNINGKFWFTFEDVIDPAVPSKSQIINDPWEFNELFYWTPDMPLIPIKQAHVIKNFLKRRFTSTDSIFYQNTDRSCVFTVVDKKVCWLTMSTINRLIYPKWQPVPFQAKPPSLIFTLRDTWFFTLPDNDPAKYAWKTGLLHRWNNSPKQYKVNPNDIAWGFKTLPSKPYYLGT